MVPSLPGTQGCKWCLCGPPAPALAASGVQCEGRMHQAAPGKDHGTCASTLFSYSRQITNPAWPTAVGLNFPKDREKEGSGEGGCMSGTESTRLNKPRD